MTEYKAGTAIELKGDHNIEWVELTEQQILDKTIEYLNKYSNCFKNWRSLIEDHPLYGPQTYIDCEIHTETNEITKMDCNFKYLLKEEVVLEYSTYNGRKLDDYFVMNSEFRIAYNIIKDLAQHGTNALR
jgi:hypothetical protein